MRVLMLANLSPLRCGEKEYALIWAGELRKLGVEITLWNGGHPASLPEDAASYDLIHVNWGPAQMGHWGEGMIPEGVPLSIFLHDVPPNSTCLLAPRAQLLMSYEPMEGSVVLDHAVPSYVPSAKPSEEITVGVTGIRGDGGHEIVRDTCARLGWGYSAPAWWEERGNASVEQGRWLSTEEEIERLARSTINVCWYHTSGRGKSMGAMFCLAARRPLILSQSTMFSHLHPYKDEIMIVEDSHYDLAGKLEPALEMMLEKMGMGFYGGYGDRAREELSWGRLAEKIKELWEGVAR
jgi:hypothetical protein